MDSSEKITGIILAGGKSTRMGFDKGLALVKGKKMIEHVYGMLRQVCDEVIIISNTDAYGDLNLKVYEDIIKDKGPLGGIYTGLMCSGTPKNLVVACDMPFVSLPLLQKILNVADGNQVVVPVIGERMEPLCGLYLKEIATGLKKLLDDEVLPVHKAVKHFITKELNMSTMEIDENTFRNINSQDDLKNIV